MTERINEHLVRRGGHILQRMGLAWGKLRSEYYIAGGAIAGHINDVDVFPVKPGLPALEERFAIDTKQYPIVSKTANATTYATKPWPTQLCHYQHDTLQALVDSFDFAHIQAGVQCSGTGVVCAYHTDAFVEAKATMLSWFTGSAYPLSSLVRAGKYYKRGDMARGSYLRAVLDCVGAVAERGFKDYDDFKDQLDAVDLGLIPEQLEEVERAGLVVLFNALRCDGGADCPLVP